MKAEIQEFLCMSSWESEEPLCENVYMKEDLPIRQHSELLKWELKTSVILIVYNAESYSFSGF